MGFMERTLRTVNHLSDLRTGDIVQLRDGDFYTVVKDAYFTEQYYGKTITNVLVGLTDECRWSDLDSYDNNFRQTSDNDFDIVKVYATARPYNMFARKDFMKNYSYLTMGENDDFTLLYREVRVTMTKEEIEDALGYFVDIVGLDDID